MSSAAPSAFAAIIPHPVKFVCTGEFSECGPLSDGDLEYLTGATAQRRREFATGRKCAVAALASLGVHVPSLEGRNGRQPDWPAGTIGSITHCEHLCAAAVSSSTATRFLGIDAELNQPLSPAVLTRVGSPDERAQIQSADQAPLPYRFTDRTLFSAKESVFKALYPVVRAYFDFDEVELRIDTSAGRFRAILSDDLQDIVGLSCLEGRYATTASHTMTAVHVGI